MENRYGYIRMREYDSAQIEKVETMKNYVSSENRLLIDETGEKLADLIEILEPEDHLFLDDLMSLGRSAAEIQHNWELIAINHHVRITNLNMPVLSCDEPDTMRNAEVINSVLKEISVGVKQYRRNKQTIGIAKARRKGVRLGRPKRKIPDNFGEMYGKWKERKISMDEAARQVGVSKSTFYNWTKKYGGCRG